MLLYLAKIAPSGRIYYRHPSGMGSVMMYYDDLELKYLRRTLVLDARYRSNQRFGCYGVRSENIDIRASLCGLSNNISDRSLISDYPGDPQSSREICNNWMELNFVIDEYSHRLGYIRVPAVSYCRSIFVDGTPCELPNINILMRIWCDREVIDDLDPTISEYPKYALSKKYNLQGDWTIGEEGSSGDIRAAYNYGAWSSTEYDSNSCWYVNYAGYVDYTNKYTEFSVVPVLEL